MIKPKNLFSSAIWNILTVLITAIAGFILVPIIIHKIGAENFGIYGIVLMVGGFAQLQSLGLGEATLKYVSQYYAKMDINGVNRVFGATLTVYIFSGIIVSGLIIIFSPVIINWFKLSPENISNAIIALRTAGLSFLLSIFSSAFKTIPEAIQRYDILNKYNLVMMVLRYFAMYLIAKFDGGIIGLTILGLISAVIDIFIYSFLAKKLIPDLKLFPNFQKKGIQEVFGYGVFSFLNDLIQRSSTYIDQLILGLFFNASSVGYLTAPKDLITKAQGLTGAASQALFPRFSSMDEGKEMYNLYVNSLWVLTIFSTIIFIPLAIIIPPFLSKWLSPEFAHNSSKFARLFSLGIAFNGGVSSYLALLKGTGRVKWLTNIISTLTILSGIVTAILVYKYGIIGSGIRVLLFSWVGSILCMYIGNKIFKDFNVIKVTIETIIIPVALSLIFFFLGSTVIDSLNIENWFEIIFSYFTLFIGMILIQFGFNWLVYRGNGKGIVLLKRIKTQLL